MKKTHKIVILEGGIYRTLFPEDKSSYSYIWTSPEKALDYLMNKHQVPLEAIHFDIGGMKYERVEDIKPDTFVMRKFSAKKVFMRSVYIRELKRYELQDVSDTSHFIFVKKGTLLLTDFDY
jgi:hypothetical protein